jgi:hypothetical protein
MFLSLATMGVVRSVTFLLANCVENAVPVAANLETGFLGVRGTPDRDRRRLRPAQQALTKIPESA